MAAEETYTRDLIKLEAKLKKEIEERKLEEARQEQLRQEQLR